MFIIEPEYVELKGGKTVVYKEGMFKLYKLEPENWDNISFHYL